MPPLLVTAAVIVRAGLILVTKRPPESRQGGLWEFPGGKLEEGETPAQALRREVAEELGLEVTVGEICDVLHHRYEWGDVLILAYWCAAPAGEARNLQVAEHRWLEPADLEALPFLPADLPLIARLKARCCGGGKRDQGTP